MLLFLVLRLFSPASADAARLGAFITLRASEAAAQCIVIGPVCGLDCL